MSHEASNSPTCVRLINIEAGEKMPRLKLAQLFKTKEKSSSNSKYLNFSANKKSAMQMSPPRPPRPKTHPVFLKGYFHSLEEMTALF